VRRLIIARIRLDNSGDGFNPAPAPFSKIVLRNRRYIPHEQRKQNASQQQLFQLKEVRVRDR
jgi:hypothetical protein